MTDAEADTLIRRAIAERRLIRFIFDGGARIAEPHDYGIRNGTTYLLVFQIGGASRSGRLPDWRWVDVARASDIEILPQTFSGGRVAPSGKHARWDRVFVRVAQPTGARDDADESRRNHARDDVGPPK